MPTYLFTAHKIARKYFFILFAFALIAPCTTMGAEPKDKPNGDGQTDSQWSSPIRLYQKTLSRADGDRCPMYPSCSHYALEAFKKHNFIFAWVLTSDRLLRCGHDETRLSKRIRVKGNVKVHDPLSANTIWWEKP